MKPLSILVLSLAATALCACGDHPTQPSDGNEPSPQIAGVASPGAPITATGAVHLHGRSGEVASGVTLSGSANVHARFQTIEQACLVFEFSGDLLDAGDELLILVDGVDAGGFGNFGPAAQAARTFCWIADHTTIVAELMDGRAKLVFYTANGSLRVVSAGLTISGLSQ